jgi:hypothetical protein
MFTFKQNQQFGQSLESVTHLLDYANQIGINTQYIIGIDQTTEQETLNTVAAQLEAMIQEVQAELELQERGVCSIGPYAGGICTICGGRQP